MSIIDPPAGWDDVDGINTNERLLGGPDGPLNRAAKGLAARTKLLRDSVTAVGTQAFNSVASLSVASGSPAFTTALVGGVQGGTFLWDASSTAAPDGALVFQPAGATTGRWLRTLPLGYMTTDMFGAVGDDSTDDTAAFVAAMASNRKVIVPPGQTLFLAQDVTITGLSALAIAGTIRIAPGKSLNFNDCPGLDYTATTIGNVMVRSTVQSFVLVDDNTTSVTLVDQSDAFRTPQDKSRFSVDDLVQSEQVVDGVAVVAWRGKVLSIVGDTLTCANDTTLGGSPALLANGQTILANSSSTQYATLNFTRCDRMRLAGAREVGTSLTNCTDYAAGDNIHRVSGTSLYYCNGGSFGSLQAEDSTFYALGVFKSRSQKIGRVSSSRARVGGFVAKNVWDSDVAVINSRESGCYPAQMRNDSGTVPSAVNSALQGTLANSTRLRIGTINAVDCYRGPWLDDSCVDMDIETIYVTGTVSGSSLLCEGQTNTRIGRATIRDHFIHGVPAGTSHANAPLRIASGNGLQIGYLEMTGCRHPDYVISTSTSAVERLYILDGLISDCSGTVNLGSVRSGSVRLRVENPRVAGGAAFTLAGNGPLSLEGSSVGSTGLAFATGFSVTGAQDGLSLLRLRVTEGVTVASVFLDSPGNDIRVTGGVFTAPAQYGITCRNAPVRLTVDDNLTLNATSGNLHTTSFTATDAVIRGKAFNATGQFAGSTIAVGATESIDIAAAVVNSLNYELQVSTSGGAADPCIYYARRQATGNVRVFRYNPTAAAVTLTAITVKLRIAQVV